MYPKIEIKLEDVSYGCNYLFFIDDLKLSSESDTVL